MKHSLSIVKFLLFFLFLVLSISSSQAKEISSSLAEKTVMTIDNHHNSCCDENMICFECLDCIASCLSQCAAIIHQNLYTEYSKNTSKKIIFIHHFIFSKYDSPEIKPPIVIS